MALLNLKEICDLIQVLNPISEPILIKNVKNNIKMLGHETLIFHLNKDEEVNTLTLQSLDHCYIVTDQPPLTTHEEVESHFLYVLDIHKAYHLFIDYYRLLFTLPIVCITGTCGKTTTKEMIKQILESKYKVAGTISNKNALNYNHDYLMSVDETTDFGIFETAISKPGDLIEGCQMFKPTIGMITNIGVDHLNGCKTMDNYIRTKGEMLTGLKNIGTLIINNDDENIKKIDMRYFKGTIITFGILNPSDFQASNISYQENGMGFTLHHKMTEYELLIPGFGEHNVYNALGAISALYTLGMEMSEIISQLPNITYIRSHLEFHQGLNNSTIIDDTWSSNPTSMKAAFEVLKEKGKGKTKIAVLGKIAYLGDFKDEHYENIAKMAVDYEIDLLITTDSNSKRIGLKAIEHGMEPHRVITCKNENELVNTLECLLDKNTLTLFKISMLDKSLTSIMKKFIIK